MLHTVDRFGKPESVAVVGIGSGQIFSGVARAGQSPPVYPGESSAVVPGGGVADGVVTDGVSVVGRQQVLPAGFIIRVRVGVGMGSGPVRRRAQVPVGVVGVGPGGAVLRLRQQLALVIVGIGRVGAAADAGDVAYGVIAVAILADDPAAGIPVGQAAHQQRGAVGACACQIAQLAVNKGSTIYRQRTGAEPFQAVIGIG